MAVWATAVCNAMLDAVGGYCNSGGAANIAFFNTAGGGALTCMMSASAFSPAATFTASANSIAVGTATGAHELGTAILFNGAGSTVASFVCATSGTTDFVFPNNRGVVLGTRIRVPSLRLYLGTSASSQIIADHTVVDRYDDIPAEYITLVKSMLLNLTGESHSAGYRNGVNLLHGVNGAYDYSTTDATSAIGAPSSSALRVAGAYRYSGAWRNCGEEDWWTNATGIAAIKAHLDWCEANDRHIDALGFGWCWDATWQNEVGDSVDGVYGCRWAGSTDPFDNANHGSRWGLDSGDTTLNMDTYLAATEEYIAYCAAEAYTTKIIFTTGPVDAEDWYSVEAEVYYQRHLKWEHIRNYVKANSTRILFDYADILAYNDAGEQHLDTWDGHDYQNLHADNYYATDQSMESDHIGNAGALRVGKAVWWLMARLAGWEG